MFEIFQRELIYVGYYFMVQLRQIAGYWILGMVIGSFVSVFAKDAIHGAFDRIRDKKWGIWGVIPASLLGVASPLCMYGTIPIAASFSRHGMRNDWLAAFMMASVLLNPQLIMYSTALGTAALAIRIISCTVCGIVAGIVVHIFYKNKPFFNFDGFEPRASHDTHPNLFLRFVFNLGRNIKATALWFLVGVLLSALFQRYVPADEFVELFGKSNEGFGVLMAATIGVPLYACGGGTIPLIREWLAMGMSMGSASAFMITGPATKITNLGALKIVLGVKRFILYIAFVMAFSLVTGFIVNLII
ncbi:MAG: permease [Eubacterium sp.]|nr:permease [Eubacterium sp.]